MKTYTITQLEEITGILAETIRSWENKYRWPMPKRNKVNYRIYTEFQLEQLLKVKKMLVEGSKITDIIVDGNPRLPTEEKPSSRPYYNFRDIPEPVSQRAKAIRKELERAINSGDVARMALLEHQLPTIHPADRHNTITALIDRFMTKTPVDRELVAAETG